MFGLFKRKKKEEKPKTPELVDLAQQPLSAGDKVESLRYDLGICIITETENGLCYRSEKDGREIHWTRMIDASTQFQKVRKLELRKAEQ